MTRCNVVSWVVLGEDSYIMHMEAVVMMWDDFSKAGWLPREVAQSCPTLCNPMNCSLPGSSIHRIFQARILELVATSWPRDRTWISHVIDRCFTVWASREVLWSCMGRGKIIPACHLFLTQLIEEVGWDRDGRQDPCCFSKECWLSLQLWRRKKLRLAGAISQRLIWNEISIELTFIFSPPSAETW